MNTLSDVLEGIPEEKVVELLFSDGDQLWLKNFTPVDESIYDRPDLFTAVLVCRMASKERGSNKGCGSNIGSLAQFSIQDVQHVFDLEEKRFLFRSLRDFHDRRQQKEN